MSFPSKIKFVNSIITTPQVHLIKFPKIQDDDDETEEEITQNINRRE